jgi:hypothetical protein
MPPTPAAYRASFRPHLCLRGRVAPSAPAP